LKPPAPALTVWTWGALVLDELDDESVGDAVGADVIDEIADEAWPVVDVAISSVEKPEVWML
jgi:hypothetical protein